MARRFLVETKDPFELNEYQPVGLDREFYLLANADRHYRFHGVYFNQLSWLEHALVSGANRMQGAVKEGSLHVAFVWTDNVRLMDTRFSGLRMILGLSGSPWEGSSLDPASCYNMVIEWERVKECLSAEAQAYLDRVTSTPWGRTSLVSEVTPMGSILYKAMMSCVDASAQADESLLTQESKASWLSDLTVLASAVIEELAEVHSPASVGERSRRSMLARDVESLLWRLPTWELMSSVASVDQMAARFHVSRRTLQLALYEFFGVGFVALSRTIRMHRVRQMLQNRREERSIASLAQEYGFTHLGRFSVQYRQMFGLSPSLSRGSWYGHQKKHWLN